MLLMSRLCDDCIYSTSPWAFLQIFSLQSSWKYNYEHLLQKQESKKRRTKAFAQKYSVKKVFLEILQNSQGNNLPCQSLRSATLLKKRLWHSCFPVNFAKFLRIPFVTEHLMWQLLEEQTSTRYSYLILYLRL